MLQREILLSEFSKKNAVRIVFLKGFKCCPFFVCYSIILSFSLFSYLPFCSPEVVYIFCQCFIAFFPLFFSLMEQWNRTAFKHYTVHVYWYEWGAWRLIKLHFVLNTLLIRLVYMWAAGMRVECGSGFSRGIWAPWSCTEAFRNLTSQNRQAQQSCAQISGGM